MYEHVLAEDPEFCNVVDHHNQGLTASLRLRDDHIFDNYERDNTRLKDDIHILEQELDWARDQLKEQRSKKPWTFNSLPPPEIPQRNLYAAAAPWPAPLPIVPDEDINMKETYPPLPTLPPPKFKEPVPGISRPVNWIPAARPTGSLPSKIPQNIEKFNNWAWAASVWRSGLVQFFFHFGMELALKPVQEVKKTRPNHTKPVCCSPVQFDHWL
jgi:hypothetical protein